MQPINTFYFVSSSSGKMEQSLPQPQEYHELFFVSWQKFSLLTPLQGDAKT